MPRKKKKEPERVEFDTFRPFNEWSRQGLEWGKPDCFNGEVHIRKWRIIAEPIEEPVEVLQERLQELWDTTDNHHHWGPLKAVAKEIGYELQGRPGNKRRDG